MQKPKDIIRVSITVAILLLPFAICDIYFGFTDQSCVHNQIKTKKIDFPLSIWLYIDSMSIIAMTLFWFGLAFISSWKANFLGIALMLFQCSKFVWGIFRLSWLIVGGVMFWGELNKVHSCNSELSDYMWANLIINLFLLGLTMIKQENEPQIIQIRNESQLSERK